MKVLFEASDPDNESADVFLTFCTEHWVSTEASKGPQTGEVLEHFLPASDRGVVRLADCMHYTREQVTPGVAVCNFPWLWGHHPLASREPGCSVQQCARWAWAPADSPHCYVMQHYGGHRLHRAHKSPVTLLITQLTIWLKRGHWP